MPEKRRRTVLPCLALTGAAWFGATWFGALGCTPPAEPPGGAAANGEDEGPAPVSVTVFTDQVELFMEYPRLLPGLEARYLAHVTVLATGEPVRSGELVLEFARAGETTRLTAEAPARDGLFIPVGAPATPGTYDARIIVRSDQVEDVVVLAPIIVHPDLESAHRAAAAEEGDDPPGHVPFLLEQQWKIGMLMEQVGRHSLIERLLVPARIEAPQGAAAVVSAPIAGRLVPGEDGVLPGIGARVEKGQVIAWVEPPLTTSDLTQLAAERTTLETLALEIQMREFDLEAKRLELENDLRQARVRFEHAEQALARIERLRAKDLGTDVELEAARRDHRVAALELEGAEVLRESYAGAAERLAQLKSRTAGADRDAATDAAPLRFPLVAPIAGEIVEAGRVEGESIPSQAAVYRIVDSSRVWVVAQVSEFDLGSVPAAPGALLEVASRPRTYDLVSDLQGSLVHVGNIVDPDARTLEIRYEVPNPDGLFRIGMFADVHLETERALEVVAIPEEAIVMDNGRPVAFVLLDGENFQKRDLVLGVRDGGLIEVRDGVQEGERVVTKGSYLVKLAAASPASFGEGHVH